MLGLKENYNKLMMHMNALSWYCTFAFFNADFWKGDNLRDKVCEEKCGWVCGEIRYISVFMKLLVICSAFCMEALPL